MTAPPLATSRPILFKPDLVCKILAGEKTETRRLISPAPPSPIREPSPPVRGTKAGQWLWQSPPLACRHLYGRPGDLLWVRETWAREWCPEGVYVIHYLAEYLKPPDYSFEAVHGLDLRWRPSIHMLREHSRVWLRLVAEVRPEPLLAIDDAGARREGFADRPAFLAKWNAINSGNPAHLNPWVWVVTFALEHTP